MTATIGGPRVPGDAITIDFVRENIGLGKVIVASFHSPDATPINDNASIELLLVTGTKQTNLVFQASAGGNSELQLFEATAVSANGVGVTFSNFNRNSAYVGENGIFHTPTVTDDGTLILDLYLAGVLGGNWQQRVNTEWILLPSTNYLFRLTNRQGSVQPLGMFFQWYEG